MKKEQSNKELFANFCEKEESKMPFSLHFSWWNEVVCDSWDVVVLENEGQVFAVWPFHIRKRGLWNLIVQPHFTPYSGIFMVYPEDQKPSTKISFENKVCEKLIAQLPEFSELQQNFHINFKNSLPLIWQGFEDQKRFTYLLDLTLSLEELFQNFRDNIRKQIRKAEKTIKIESCHDSSNLKKAFESTFEAQGISSPIDDEGIFERIGLYIQKRNCGKLLEAKDVEGNLHAAICLIWDTSQAYYLIGGAIKDYKNSGAMSLLLWQVIQLAKEKNLSLFNFEGSSISAIEKYLRGFGGELIGFSRIYKNNSSSLKLAKKIKG